MRGSQRRRTAGPTEATSEAGWDGKAQALASAAEFASLRAAGFDPVGQVSGVTVARFGYIGATGRCSGSASYTPRTDLASTSTSGALSTWVRRQYSARRQALARAAEQCVRFGGDGIVAAQLLIRPFPAGGTEFTVQGTAVRARCRTRPAAPFTAHLSGQDFVLLLGAGWVPVALVVGIGLGSRHDVVRTLGQTRRFTAGDEVTGYSALVRDTRRDAREQLRQAVGGLGAEGVLARESTLRISERECPSAERSHDHIAQVELIGTAICSFRGTPRPAGGAPLTILRMNAGPAAPAALPKVSLDPTGPTIGALPEQGASKRLVARLDALNASRSVYSGRDSAPVTREGGADTV